jgi:hypothetical protein
MGTQSRTQIYHVLKSMYLGFKYIICEVLASGIHRWPSAWLENGESLPFPGNKADCPCWDQFYCRSVHPMLPVPGPRCLLSCLEGSGGWCGDSQMEEKLIRRRHERIQWSSSEGTFLCHLSTRYKLECTLAGSWVCWKPEVVTLGERETNANAQAILYMKRGRSTPEWRRAADVWWMILQ